MTMTLASKLAQVMATVGRIPKRGRNSFHGYDYATEADIAEAVRSELASRFVVLIPEVTSIDYRELGVNKKGDQKDPLSILHMTFTFYDGESGESITKPWIGVGQDGGDKGAYKAMTGAAKYFLMKTFLMPTGDDPEHDSKDDKGAVRERDNATVKLTAAEKKSRPPTPEGAVYLDKVVPRTKGNSSWAEIITSTGEEFIANVPQLISLAYNIVQENVPVLLSTHVNSKGKTQLDAINRAVPLPPAPSTAPVVQPEDAVM